MSINVIGVGPHLDSPDVKSNTIVVKLSDEVEAIDSSLHINNRPFPLLQGDMILFGSLIHEVPVTLRSSNRLTLSMVFVCKS